MSFGFHIARAELRDQSIEFARQAIKPLDPLKREHRHRRGQIDARLEMRSLPSEQGDKFAPIGIGHERLDRLEAFETGQAGDVAPAQIDDRRQWHLLRQR